ncbi:hypothetical protein HanIR_Chr07g0313821 [Helianthus annuus]|nr:hypothetical protein HanIR_Chr07g0313821 [Helianthus annuus]
MRITALLYHFTQYCYVPISEMIFLLQNVMFCYVVLFDFYAARNMTWVSNNTV